MKLEILLRTCNKHENNPNMKRIMNVSRDELILRCTTSFVSSINELSDEVLQSVKVTIIDDSTTAFIIELQNILDTLKCSWKFIHKELTNNESMKYCYEYAMDNFEEDSVIYFSEDDYLYFPNCFMEIIEAYEMFTQRLGGKEVVIHPANSPTEYFPEAVNSPYAPSIIVLSNYRHWRTSVSCAFTMLISKKTFIRFYDKFMDYSKFDGVNFHEANTINLMFIDQVKLFTPIPTLCFHLGYIYPPSPFCDHLKLWETSYNIRYLQSENLSTPTLNL